MITQDQEEINLLKKSGRILAEVLQTVAENVRPGISAFELDQLAEREIKKRGAVGSFKDYKSRPGDPAFPASLCVSVNDEVVHGIPHKEKVLKQGDIVGLDLGINYEGYFTDAAITVAVGKADPEALRLIDTARLALNEALNQAVIGNHIGDISNAIEQTAKKAGFTPVRDLVGHGVGRSVHEDPEVPCVGKKGTGPLIRKGMVLAIEPMVNQGTHQIYFDDDNWTVRTVDGGLSAHMEHTVIITDSGAEIITKI